MGEGDVGQVSPDGKWYWDGRSWLSAVSPDGKSRWNGTAWVAAQPLRRASYTNPWAIGAGVGGVAVAILVAVVIVAAMVMPTPKVGQQSAAVQTPRPSQPGTSPLAVVGTSPNVTPSSTPSPSLAPSPKAVPKPTPKPTPKPSPKPVVKLSTCGAPANPWGFNFCGGSVIYSPPSGFCGYFPCISSFGNSPGYIIECKDGKYSTAGGRSGACSTHGGVWRALYKR